MAAEFPAASRVLSGSDTDPLDQHVDLENGTGIYCWGGTTSTSQPTASTRETRLGSMIFTSDSPATKVVRRMLLGEVFSTTGGGPNFWTPIAGSSEYDCWAACQSSRAKPGDSMSSPACIA